MFKARNEHTYQTAEIGKPQCEERVVVYMSPYCKYCTAARTLLDSIKMPYQVIDIHNDLAKRAELAEKTGRKTVPQIYINDLHIGGFDDLKALHDNGKLQKFRESCNVGELK